MPIRSLIWLRQWINILSTRYQSISNPKMVQFKKVGINFHTFVLKSFQPIPSSSLILWKTYKTFTLMLSKGSIYFLGLVLFTNVWLLESNLKINRPKNWFPRKNKILNLMKIIKIFKTLVKVLKKQKSILNCQLNNKTAIYQVTYQLNTFTKHQFYQMNR